MKLTHPQSFTPSAHTISVLSSTGLACAILCHSAWAATFTYNNTASNMPPGTNWSDATNWNTVPLSATSTTLTFTGTLADGATIFSNNNIAGNFQLNKMGFTHVGPDTGIAPTLTISGNPLEFKDSATLPTLTFNTTGTVQPAVVIHNNLILKHALSVSAISSGTIDGSISGPGDLKKTTGNQTLTLAGTNSYTGATIISSGTLIGIGANAFGSTTSISIGGDDTLSLRGDTSTSFVKASDSLGYAVITTADGSTLNVDQATPTGTSAKTMTLGTLEINKAELNATHFTGANHTSLSIGAVTTGTSAGGTETLKNSIIGGGTLTLANVAIMRTGSPTLKFDGGGHTIVSGAITEVAPTELNKSGTGTLTINGNCGLTGTTTVNDGTLHLTGSLDSAVSVKNTGILSGTGSISGNVSVASGGHLAFAIAANPAAQDPLNIDGTLSLVGGNIIDLSVLSTAPINGNYILASAIGAGGVTYANSSTVKLGSIIGNVSVIGNSLVLTVTGSSNTYETWAQNPHGLSGGNAAFDYDFDHDGLDNGLEWILGGNPTTSSQSASPTAVRDGANNFVLSFTREEDSIGKSTLILEYSSSLANWNSFTIDSDGGTDSNGVIVTINQTVEPDAVTITIPATAAPDGRIFTRLKAVK